MRRNRDFLLLWSGEVVSTLGSQVSLVAFPLLVLATTGSPAKAGLVGFANQIPVLAFYLPAGVLVDRHDRRTIMAAVSVVAALALASVPIALAFGRLAFGQIIVVAFLAGTRQVIYSVAEQGALPLVVQVDQVPEAIVRNQARSEAAMLAGPPLGGVLFGLARALPFLADAISYVISTLGVLAVRTPLQEPRTAQRRRAVTEIAEGLRWFWSHTFLRTSALAVAAANFTWMALELVLIIRARQHGAGAAAVGLMLAMIGVGGLLGAVIAPPIARRLPSPVIVIGTFWVEAALFPLLVLTHDPYVLGAITAVASLLGPAWNAVVVGARLTLTPDRLRGRVNSAARLISGSLLALGPLAAGLLSQSVGTTYAQLMLAGWQLLLALGATASKSLRSGLPHDRKPGPATPTAPSMTVVKVVIAEAGEYVDAAAQIWAEATAARDGDTDVAPLDLSRPIIEAVINSSDRSLLLIALDADRRVLGFAAAEPTSDVEARRAELRYLGVRPDAWSGGVAAQLLTALRRQLKAAGFATAQLMVYTENTRASALYQRLGWTAHGGPRPHPRSGRPEQSYTLNLEDELVDKLLSPRPQRSPSSS